MPRKLRIRNFWCGCNTDSKILSAVGTKSIEPMKRPTERKMAEIFLRKAKITASTAAAITVIARLAYPLNGSSQNTVDIPKSENEQSAMAARKIM